MVRLRLASLMLLLPAAVFAASAEQTVAGPAGSDPLPRFPALDDAVSFWVRVFSEVGTDGGLLHDARYLDVVYTVVRPPGDAGGKSERARIKALTSRYRDILRELAQDVTSSGQAPTSEESQRVAALWRHHGPDALAGAADRLRFQRGQANRFRDGIARAGAWQNYIRDTLKAAGVPETLAALPHVESSFDPTAHSHAGASGLWQFTPSTGRRFMQIDQVVDERLDPHLSTKAAAQLLRHNFEVTGSWPLAITAYNHGAAGTRRAVEQLGTRDLGLIAWKYRGRSFGFASRNFYAAFLAALEVESRAPALFGEVARQTPDNSRSVAPADYVSARSLAAAVGVDLDTLRRHNPALRPPVWSGEKRWPRGFPVRLPAAHGPNDLTQALVRIPPEERYDAQVPDKYHSIRAGEALSGIAARYGTTVRELARLNDLRDPHRIRAGVTLILPAGAEEAAERRPAGVRPAVAQSDDPPAMAMPASLTVATVPDRLPPTRTPPADSDDGIAALTATGDEIGMPLALGADPSNFDVADDDSIEIQPFETLGHYADWLGLTAGRLRARNGLSRQHTLIVGERLRLDFTRVDRAAFEARRRDHHRTLQEAFFASYRISGTGLHPVRRGDSLWRLSHRFSDVPIWLIRQYNPDLDFSALKPGTAVAVPVLEPVLDAEIETTAAGCAC